MNVSQALLLAEKELYLVPDRDVDAAWIVCRAVGITRSMLQFSGEKVLTEAEEAQLCAMLARRKTREPLQHIFGTVPFCGLELKTDRRALIPRDETSLLAEEAALRIAAQSSPRVLDLCTGSGAIALWIRHENPGAEVTGADLSPEALELAKENGLFTGLSVNWVQSDLFRALEGQEYTCIVSNPPYVSAQDMETLEKELSYEPEMALDGGRDGLDFYRSIAAEAPGHLAPGGLLMLEIGYDQAEAVYGLLSAQGFEQIECRKDYAGLDRFVFAVKGAK